MNTDPLKMFYCKYGFKQSDILKYSIGENYLAIMLNNGCIGVAASLKNKITIEISELNSPNFNRFEHRLFLMGYYNALLNYKNTYETEADIFKVIGFEKYKNLVMVGLFESLYKNLKNNGISPIVFDQGKNDDRTQPMEKQKEFLKNTNALILTSTSIINGSYINLIRQIPQNCDVFMLGPSGILSKEMFYFFPNISYIFGSVFNKFDYDLLELIERGAGTKGFLNHLKKVYIKNEL
ncbi:MAG: DUF364 domain-containing protein [Bacteroidales bacterium]|nr:DUF364 domain-containing protein [Bacteroidales bacterium]MDD4236296.1 DUF364 domain-containing protein [Bacteroidales bacterium]